MTLKINQLPYLKYTVLWNNFNLGMHNAKIFRALNNSDRWIYVIYCIMQYNGIFVNRDWKGDK